MRMVTFRIIFTQNHRDVNNAVEEYFSKGYGEKASVTKTTFNASKMQQTFNLYKDGSSGRIEGEGI